MTYSGGHFRVSPYLQEIACFMGQEEVFDRAEGIIEKLTGVMICDKQIERICHHYGEKIQIKNEQEIKSGKPYKLDHPDEVHYGMIDGGMVLTREDHWKEMKIARVFPRSALLNLHETRHWLKESLYVAHLGDIKGFLPLVGHIFDSIKKLVIIADGAPWIWLWVEANYPDAIQILDFFHAKEHLCHFAEEYFRNEEKRKQWIEKQTQLFFEDDVDTVIKNISALPVNGRKKAADMKKSLVNYYRTNQERMYYQTFTERGLMIGSGPIEAAHRHLIQKRLKLSGQRWTKAGAQKIANLRVANKSGQWWKVCDQIKNVA